MEAMVVTVATTAALATTMLGMVVMEAMEAMAAMAAMVHIVASETFMAEHWKLLRAGFVDVMNDETTRTMSTEYHFFVFNKTISIIKRFQQILMFRCMNNMRGVMGYGGYCP